MLGECLAHTPSRLVNEHIGTGEDFLAKINKTEAVIAPEKLAEKICLNSIA